MLSSKNILTNCIQTIARFGFVEDERVFGVFHFFIVLRKIPVCGARFVIGCTVIIVPKIERRYILEGLNA